MGFDVRGNAGECVVLHLLGSGIHRSLLGRLFLDNYTIVIQESGGYIDKDFTSLRTMEGDTTEGATH